MAHPCKYCEEECFCSGDFSDSLDGQTPARCKGCGYCNDPGHARPEDGFDDNEEEEDVEDEGWAQMSCGLNQQGECDQVGSTFCEWYCPYSRQINNE